MKDLYCEKQKYKTIRRKFEDYLCVLILNRALLRKIQKYSIWRKIDGYEHIKIKYFVVRTTLYTNFTVARQGKHISKHLTD
jgi:hypothetical protein